MIKQVGNKVFKEVTVAGHKFIVEFLAEHGLTPEGIRRFWLHQANARMNAMILRLAFGRDVDHDRAPMVLDRLGNTAGAGAIIALLENHADMKAGDYGLLCAFGAGYSIGGALLKMLQANGLDGFTMLDLFPETMPTPEIVPGRKLAAKAVWLFAALGGDFQSSAVGELQLGFEGIGGDFHAGFTRRSGGREQWYPRGTEMRNERQLTLVAPDELAIVAERMGLPEIKPEWIGANLVIDGLPQLSMLPAGTLLFFEGGVTLKVEGQNHPCRIAGRSIAENAGMPDFDAGALLFPKMAKRLRGLVAWVEKPGTVRPGETISVRVPEQWIYRG